MDDDRADELNALAADLEAEVVGTNPTSEHEAGVVEGMGRAVGKAQERARQLTTLHVQSSEHGIDHEQDQADEGQPKQSLDQETEHS
jgi:hypothetical protein